MEKNNNNNLRPPVLSNESKQAALPQQPFTARKGLWFEDPADGRMQVGRSSGSRSDDVSREERK